jgi:hypothetical protein
VVHSGKSAADAAGEASRSREDADRRPEKMMPGLWFDVALIEEQQQ